VGRVEVSPVDRGNLNLSGITLPDKLRDPRSTGDSETSEDRS